MLRVIRFLNGLITFMVVIVLAVSAAYAGYSLWDNQQVYDAVENTMDEMRAIRAKMDAPKTQNAMEALIASGKKTTPEPEPASTMTETPTAAPAEETAETITGTVSDTHTAEPAATAEERPAVVSGETVTENPADQTGNVPAETPEASGETPAETSAEDASEKTTAAPEENPTESPTEKPAATPTAAPTEEPADDSPFAQLKAINPDITAWITMPGTAIDYPILQGSSNYSYINTDVYGNFALAGSIFLDYRNDENFEDNYSLVYGHDMAKSRMFGDINLYKDKEFFEENHLGVLLTPKENHLLLSIACVVTPAGNSSLFNPDNWKNYSPEQILKAVQEDAALVNPEGLDILKERLDAEEPYHVVALSTCSDEFTDARTILLTLMDP